jgi:1-acyl-sn-glycerol-3-phosphate acyltransferase
VGEAPVSEHALDRPRWTAGSLLRTGLFTATYKLGTGVLGTVMAPYLFRLPRRELWRWTQRWAQGVLWLLRSVCDIRYQILGQEHIPAGPVIYAVKHQSAWESIIAPLLFADGAAIIRQELLAMPVYGWYLRRLGLIPIDQAAEVAAMFQIVAESQAAVKQGRSVIIFPEGERVPVGQRLPYHPGVGALYKRLELPVVPVALNAGVFWPLGVVPKRPGCITLEFLPAIQPGLPRKEFLRTLEDRIETATARLVAAASERI